jgi:uncharacterized protein with ParB-like and HNH nuclease domain
MQAHNMPFTKLINVDQGAREHFHVPKYQREYTWKKWQWEQLLNDIQDNNPGYFMGSIICVNDNQHITPGDELIFEVVDGQQRLTTLSLLLAAIYAKLSMAIDDYNPADDQDKEDAKSAISNIRAKLIKRKKDTNPGELGAFTVGKNVYFLRVQPSAQSDNLADYRYILSEVGLLEEQTKKPYFGNRLLSRAYTYFHEQISADVEDLLRLMERINQLMFVQITVSSQSDAFTLFESLNNRGVPLSAMDIIKNKMLAQMEKRHAVDIDDSFNRWQTLVDAIPDASDQERFLRHFYNAFKHDDTIRVDKVPHATRSIIIRVYETLINRDAALLFDKLTNGAQTYGKLLMSAFEPKPIAAGLTELDRIGSAPAYIILLYLFSLDNKHFDSPQFLEKVIDLMVRYFIRRNVTDVPPTRQIDRALIDVVEACADHIKSGNRLNYHWFEDALLKYARPGSLADFRAALSGQIYDTNLQMARYLLIQIDQMHHSREYQPDFWARDDKGRFIWTVEHVLPQTEKLPDHWVQMIAAGDRHLATELQERSVHCLGNLTLSGYNSDLATANFTKKQTLAKDRSFLGHKINIGYQNGLYLNSLVFATPRGTYSLANAPHWDIDMIHARTMQMVDLVIKKNLLPGDN